MSNFALIQDVHLRQLTLAVPALAAVVIDPAILIALTAFLLLGLRALDHPGSRRWAGTAVTIVVLTPLTTSLAGLVAIVTS